MLLNGQTFLFSLTLIFLITLECIFLRTLTFRPTRHLQLQVNKTMDSKVKNVWFSISSRNMSERGLAWRAKEFLLGIFQMPEKVRLWGNVAPWLKALLTLSPPTILWRRTGDVMSSSEKDGVVWGDLGSCLIVTSAQSIQIHCVSTGDPDVSDSHRAGTACALTASLYLLRDASSDILTPKPTKACMCV